MHGYASANFVCRHGRYNLPSYISDVVLDPCSLPTFISDVHLGPYNLPDFIPDVDLDPCSLPNFISDVDLRVEIRQRCS